MVVLVQQTDGCITKEGLQSHVEKPMQDVIIVHMDTLNKTIEIGKSSSMTFTTRATPMFIANSALEATCVTWITENICQLVGHIDAIAKLDDSSILLLSKKAKQRAVELMDVVLSEQDLKNGRKK